MKDNTNTIFHPSSLLVKVIAPTLLFIICFVIRLIYLTAQDICIDEPFSIYHAQGSFSDIVKYLKPTNNPPLFELILRVWIKLFGISAFSVRFLPMIFGSLAVIFIYKIGLRSFSFWVGVSAALLYSFSTHAIYYAHDCRVYTLFLLLSVVSVYYTSKIISNNFTKRDLVLLCFINVLLVYSHYFGFFIWFVEFIGILLFSRKQWKSVFVLFVIALVFFLPQLFNLVNQFLFSAKGGTWMKEPTGMESIYNMFWLFSNMPVVAVFCLLLIIGTVIQFFVVRKMELESNLLVKRFIYLCFFLPFVLMFLVSYKIPIYNGRYLFFILPFYYLSISIMAESLFKNVKLKYALLATTVVLFILTVQLNPSKKREAKAVVEFVKQIKKPGDIVIICTHEFLTNFAYYYNQNIFKIIGEDEYTAIETKLRVENIYPVRKMDEIGNEILSSAKRIIYVEVSADFSNPGNNVLTTLRSSFKEQEKKHFEQIFNVYTFEKNAN
ncbi:MAG: glycosyltransferase family 39 protein [Bacteroidia bacterium]|nr:glycosyltransferase family 39 protein [Bacteroidia bacterium]